MIEFNELQSTNDYLMGELILARQANEIMTENNFRLERLLSKALHDLQDARRLMDQLSNSVNDLTNLVTSRVAKR
jgi:pyridoxal/pyridoxine/pyridoxamine kinase